MPLPQDREHLELGYIFSSFVGASLDRHFPVVATFPCVWRKDAAAPNPCQLCGHAFCSAPLPLRRPKVPWVNLT